MSGLPDVSPEDREAMDKTAAILSYGLAANYDALIERGFDDDAATRIVVALAGAVNS